MQAETKMVAVYACVSTVVVAKKTVRKMKPILRTITNETSQ